VVKLSPRVRRHEHGTFDRAIDGELEDRIAAAKALSAQMLAC
jgi:hypothetical protein